MDRQAQLRRAKQAQRRRERKAGLAYVQLRLPREHAARLREASRSARFVEEHARWLDGFLVRVADYPALAELLWNRRAERIPADEAFRLYERNWRFVDKARLMPAERALIERLAERFGGGLLNA